MQRKPSISLIILILASIACSIGGTSTPESPPISTPTETPLPTSTFTPSPVPDTPTPTPQVIVIIVPADAGWVNTGIDVTTSQNITISTTGDVNTWNGADISNSDADGQPPYICERTDCAMIDMNFGTLVGRIDDREAFRVGTSFLLVPAFDGRLYLAVNDWEYFDNLREFEVTLTIP